VLTELASLYPLQMLDMSKCQTVTYVGVSSRVKSISNLLSPQKKIQSIGTGSFHTAVL